MSKGGRNYRLNWTDGEDSATFGDWQILLSSPGTAHPYKVQFEGSPLLTERRLYRCFASIDNAKRWVERQIQTKTSPKRVT